MKLKRLQSPCILSDQKQIAGTELCAAIHSYTPRQAILSKTRLNKLLQLRGKQTVKPRDVGGNVCHPTGRKQVRNQNRKNSASLFSLMRDNKQSNSTTYGGVQAGRCSKQPCHSLPYGVTNCCFSAVTERYTKGDGWKEQNREPEMGQKFDGTDDVWLAAASWLGLKGL